MIKITVINEHEDYLYSFKCPVCGMKDTIPAKVVNGGKHRQVCICGSEINIEIRR